MTETSGRVSGFWALPVALAMSSACQSSPPSPTAAPAKPAAEAPKPADEPTKPVAPASASPAVASSPGAVPSPAAAASPSPSSVAAAPTVAGPIDSIEGRLLTVAINTGPKQVRVPDGVRIEQEARVPSTTSRRGSR
jgi:hypothetical protein